MKNLLMITSGFPPTVSGISTYYYNLLKYLPADRVTVLAPWSEGCEGFDKQAPFRIIRKRCDTGASTKAKLKRMLTLSSAAAKIVIRDRVGSLHCGQAVSNGPFGWLMHKLLGLPYYVYLHGGDGETLRRFEFVNSAIRAIINRSQVTFANSNSTRSEFAELGVDEGHLAVVHPSVDPNVFRPDVDPRRVRRKHGLRGKKVILTVARLGHIKGHDRVIGVLPEVVEAVPNAMYLITGTGPERERLDRLVAEKGMEDHVVFAGYVPDDELPEYYAACDVFAMTSIQVPNHDVEGFGIVYLEASACGKPVVGSRTGGVAEAVAEGESGVLVNPNSLVEIRETLTRLLSDDAYAKQLGRAGRLRVEREFSWERSAKRLRSFLS